MINTGGKTDAGGIDDDAVNEFQAMYTPLSAVTDRRPVTLGPEATVREALETMERLRIGSVIVVEPGSEKPVGIFTLQDVLRRVALPGHPVDAPITEVMTTQLVTVKKQALAYDAALLMARRNLRHLLVVDDEQRLFSVVSKNDLFDLQRSGVRDMTQEICGAPDLATLQKLTYRIRHVGVRMIAQGVSAGPLTYFVSSLNDLLTQRIIELTAAKFDLPDTAWCWLSFGSEGRFEQTFSTDQDNGLMFAARDAQEAETFRQRFLPFCQAVNQRLDVCGFSLCKGNIMAGNPELCLSVEEWQAKFSNWIRTPVPQALLNATIFFDFRPLYGDQTLAQRLWDDLIELIHGFPVMLHMMARNALDVAPPIGRIRDFITESDAEHEGMIDLKKDGIRLFVDAARILSLQSGVWQTNTAYRLRHTVATSGANEEEIGAIIQAFYFIQRIRLRNQHKEIEEGAEASNYIDPDQLNEIDRRILLESFKQARKLQQRLRLEYRL